MSGPAFDEGLPQRDQWGEILPYRCKRHQDRVAVEPISYRRCEQCRNDAQAGYADAMIKRDKLRGHPQHYPEYTPHGEILGPDSREARHDKNFTEKGDK